MTKEIIVQERVTKWLEEKETYPFNVTYTRALGSGNEGLLSITFFMRDDLEEFLDLIDYKTTCDKAGYIILEDSNTVILVGLALIRYVEYI